MSFNTTAIIFPLLACIFCILPTFGNFIPQQLPGLTSDKCQEEALDISEVLTSVAEMLSSNNNPTPSSHPLSCLEVKESSSGSPSGYYTLSDGTVNTNIVYCNMDKLYSCPSLEQTLKGLQLSLDQNTNAITSQLESSQEFSSSFSTAINDTVNDVLHLTQQLINLHPPASCQEALDKTTNLITVINFEDLCNTTGPWTRVAFLNMSDPTGMCSCPFALYESNGVKACGRPHPLTYSCHSVTFPVTQTSYSQVCGRITGYQYYRIDGFSSGRNIDQQYVDGISLTYGSPRQHIWSFAAAKDISGSNSCPCAGGGSPPAFVGNDYFCESGSNGTPLNQTMYTSDPLWDGQGCVDGEVVACCQATGIPWFHKILSTSTTDFIELRICGYSDEDSPLSLYEIYVK